MSLRIKLSPPRNRRVGSQISVLIGILGELTEFSEEQQIEFNFSRIRFVQPIFLASIAALIMQLRSSGKRVRLINRNETISEYFKAIYFPNGLKLDQRKNWESKLKKYLGKNFIPLIYFQSGNKKKETILRDNILSVVSNLLMENCNIPQNMHSALVYLIGEMTDNIVEHSGQERGWITAHYYRYKGYVEICLVDSGCGLLGSYQNNGRDVKSHNEAIKKALEGLSTKGDQRGYGVHTSNNMIAKGLKGVFAIFTGDALLIDNNLMDIPVSWEGTVIVLRIPTKKVKNFDYRKYLE